MPEVLHLFQSLEHGQPVREFEQVLAVENRGFEKCLHGRPNSARQVLLIDIETLTRFGVTPGGVKENVTTQGITLGELSLGQRLRIGDAVLEVTKPCTTCHLMDEIRQGLQEAMNGQRGILCRVIRTGRINRGDAIEVIGEEQVRESRAEVDGRSDQRAL